MTAAVHGPRVTQAVERLERSTWDNRVSASRHDVHILLDALSEALAEYDEPMSCFTSAERGEILASRIAALAKSRTDATGEGA